MLKKYLVCLVIFSSFAGCSERQAPKSVKGKAIICGVCKDIEKAMPYSIKNIEALGNLFDDYHVIVYENNSTDRTPALLSDWSSKNPHVAVISEVVNDEILSETCFNKTIQNEFYRPERIARARNIVLNEAMNSQFDDYQYVIWFDLDFEHEIVLQPVIDTFYSKQEWDAVFANGVDDAGRFYDSYSLRDHHLPFGAELIGNQWWHTRGNIHLKFKPNDAWYPVFSAFGGMGIYKRDAIKGCAYSATVTKNLETLEKQMMKSKLWKLHSEVTTYYDGLNVCRTVVHLPETPCKEMPYYERDSKFEGFILGEDKDGLIFRMNSGVGQYPSICEHVPFHATMILNGHDKLFINPALILYYFGRT